MILVGSASQACYGGAKEIVPEKVMSAMEKADAAMSSFRCKFSVTYQNMVRHESGEDGKDVVIRLAPDEFPPAEIHEHDVLVADGKWWRRDVDQSQNPPIVRSRTWDGSKEINWNENAVKAQKDSKVKYYWGGRINDPRDFAFQNDPNSSRLSVLRQSMDEGTLSMSHDSLGDVKTVRVEGTMTEPGSERVFLYKVWVDPAKGFMPVQTDVFIAGSLALRYHNIELTQVSAGRWFPTKGTLDNIQFRDQAQKGITNMRIQMVVDPESVKLDPDIAPDAFTLRVPPGIEIVDFDEMLRARQEAAKLPQR
jgi:hypothetical protein